MPSSVIHGMRYSPLEKTLEVVFQGSRGAYRYFDVTAEEWLAFKRAPSKGTYLNVVFKAGHPRVERLAAMRPSVIATIAGNAASGASLRDLPHEDVWGFYESSL